MVKKYIFLLKIYYNIEYYFIVFSINMYEIELKYKLTSRTSYKQIMDALSEIIDTSHWSKSIFQEDIIFRKKKYINLPIKTGEKIFRLRQTSSDTTLTLKIQEDNSLTYTEFESKVDNCNEIQNMIIAMGYSTQIKLYKNRYAVKYNNLTICFDQVKNIGSFIEIELISNINQNLSDSYNSFIIRDIMSKLNSFKPTPIHQNYITLAMEKLTK